MASSGTQSTLWLSIAVLTALSGVARADDDDQPPPPPPGYPPAPQPMYPTPMSQTVQPSYVPQSVAMSGPEEIDEDTDGRQPPPGYTSVQRRRKGLLIAGPIVLGSVYGYTALIAAAGTDLGAGDSVAPLFIPVLGPFIEMGKTDSYTARYLLAIDGGAQLAGAIMLYYGLTTTKTVFVRNDMLSMTVAPMMTPDAQGLSVLGTF